MSLLDSAAGRVVRAHVEELTEGWSADRKAAVWRQIIRDLVRASPGKLALAVDPTTVQTPALDLIDQALTDVEEGRCLRLIICMPPQEGKSTRVVRCGGLWALLRDPSRRIAIASYAAELAAGHAQWIRDTINTWGADAPAEGGTDILGLAVSKLSRAASRFSIRGHRGGVIAAGVAGGLTGKPVDFMFIDDPFKDRLEADSIVIRNRVWQWWTDVVIPRLAPGAPVVLVMTRWHEDDLAGRLIAEDQALPEDERQWRVVNIPAQCEDPAGDPLGRAAGEFMVSARGRTEKEWQQRKTAVGARSWSALFQGHPSPMEGGLFQWDWIRPQRIARDQVPQLARIVVAVDPTGGGADAAGVIAAGRGVDGRTYILGDRSGNDTMGGQWRRAWLAVLEFEANSLVYESNLVDPAMRKAIPSAWARLREQAAAIRDAGLLTVDHHEITDVQWNAAARHLGRDDDAASDVDPAAVLVQQVQQVHPWAARILEAPEQGPANVIGVRATRGKLTRAEPMALAYETGRVSHVGVLPALEAELVTWQEGQPSPNRLDADAWAWTALNSALPASTSTPAGRGGVRVPRGPQTMRRPGGGRR